MIRRSTRTGSDSSSSPEGPEVRRWMHLTPGVAPAVLARVLTAMPEGLHPAEIEGFLTTKNPNLAAHGHLLTIGEYLASGGDVEVAVGLAQDLDRW